MKLSNIKCVFVALLVAFNANASERGDGTRGGGEIVNIEGHPALRDLHEKTVCRWKKGARFRNELKALPSLLKSLEKTHWFLSDFIALEAYKLNVCWTEGELRHIDTQDEDSIAQVQSSSERPVAIRLNYNIYIDRILFTAMPDHDKAYVYIRLVLHSFLPLGTPQRNSKLASIVAAIEENERTPLTFEDFAFQLKKNQIIAPENPSRLLGSRADLVLALNPSALHDERLFAAYRFMWPIMAPLIRPNRYGEHTYPSEDQIRNTFIEELATLKFLKSNSTILADLFQEYRQLLLDVIQSNDAPRFARLLTEGLEVNEMYFFQPDIGTKKLPWASIDIFEKNWPPYHENKNPFSNLYNYALTPLGWALYFHSVQITKLLAQHTQTNPNARVVNLAYFDLSPLQWAARTNDLVGLQELSLNTKLEPPADWAPIEDAIKSHRHEVLRALLSRLPWTWGSKKLVSVLGEFSCNGPDYINMNPLHLASATGDLGSVQILLNTPVVHAINVNEQTSTGDTALTLATEKKHSNIVLELLKTSGIEVNTKTTRTCGIKTKTFPFGDYSTNGHSPLMLAAASGQIDVVKALLQDPSTILNLKDNHSYEKDSNGYYMIETNKLFTAKDMAYGHGHSEIVQMIESEEKMRKQR